jgi:hypothetical protein
MLLFQQPTLLARLLVQKVNLLVEIMEEAFTQIPLIVFLALLGK